MAAAPSLVEVVRARLGDFSPAERRVARTFLAGYPSAGLETVARLAERAGTSGPSVLRFVTRLGFAGYPEFQQAVRDELDERTASPLVVHQQERRTGGGDASLLSARKVFPAGVKSTLDSLPPDEVAAAVALLADPNRRITCAGGRFTRLLGEYLVLHLMQLRGSARMLPDAAVPRADALLEIGKKDVVVLFDYRRYERATFDLASQVSEAGAKTILLTDRWLSPIAATADVVLPARTDAPSAYDSYVPTIAVIETLVAGVFDALGPAAEKRLERFEQVSVRHTLV